MTEKNEVIEEENFDYIGNEYLASEDGGQLVSSSMLASIFIPSKRVPKALLDKIATDKAVLEQHLLANIPLFQHKVSKPYWGRGINARQFDAINIDIYGAVCLADDRHLLDTIIAHGGLLDAQDKYTLRSAAERIGLNVIWEFFPDQSMIDRPLKNYGVAFHVAFSDICRAMGLANTKPTRNTILQRLQRLSIMTLNLKFERNGQALPHTKKMSLIDRDYFALCATNAIKNKKMIKPDTITDLIVLVDPYYVQSLSSEGEISRSRFLNDYPDLVGRHSIVDFFKYLDGHKRQYLHNKRLSDLVADYFNDKMSLFGMNNNYKFSVLINLVVEKKEELRDKFSIELQAVSSAPGDYSLTHIPTLLGSENQ